MKVTTLLKIAVVALFVMAVFVGDSFSQQTYYVNAKNGLDGWDGSSPVYVGPGVGPKKTMNNAILNASAGDIISADYAEGNLYNENVVITKALTIVSTNGTPQVVSWDVQAPITVSGPFRLNTGLTLTAGAVTGASNLTVGGQVTRTAGSVDSQLNYTGVVNFVYNGGAAVAPMTTGLELPPSSNTANFGNLTTTAGTDLVLNEDKVMNGILNTAAKINLNTFTLYVVNSTIATTHAVGGDITNGTMEFTLNSNSTVNGLFKLPHVKVMSSNATRTLTVSNAIDFEGITNYGLATIIVNHDNAVTIGVLDLRAGKIQIWNTVAAAGDVTVTGNASFIAGTFDMGTTAVRTLHLKGPMNVFSSTTGRTDFSSAGMRNVTLEFSAAATAQSVTGNLIETVWFGIMNVNNTSGFSPAVTFQGGDFRVLDDLLFSSGRVKIIDKKLIVGGRLAPYNNTVAGTAEFTNTAGYITEGNGFVSMNSDLNSQVSGPGSFGNFEVDMATLNLNVLPATGPMTAQFNLAKGQVTSSANVNFNFAVPPVIIRNEGTFDAAPTFTTQVDVIYINKDKVTGPELPASPAFADKLRNLSILTTNGTLVAGKGTIEVPPATPVTVNGTLTVNAGQTLLLNASSLTMKGST
ncbi:MAG: hypothetical protein V2J62_03290, partial [candidate division KSB1 bacterium]|nr:hypothetical protein [candidate division KSB1 bacterium]